jgi:hypothetical protein
MLIARVERHSNTAGTHSASKHFMVCHVVSIAAQQADDQTKLQRLKAQSEPICLHWKKSDLFT